MESPPLKRPKAVSPLSNKRSRSIGDVDGEDLIPQIKKRRLRLLFVTSRLSSPFSEPSTYVLSHGAHKIASWIRRAIRAIRPPPPLVQVALLNNARMQAAISLSEAQILSRDQLREAIERRRIVLQPKTTRNDPLPHDARTKNAMHKDEQALVLRATMSSSSVSSTSLELSDYDIFDSEPEATAGEREEGWENANTVSEIYSDFTVLRPIEAVVDDDIGPFPESILAERHDWDNPNIYEKKAPKVLRHEEE